MKISDIASVSPKAAAGDIPAMISAMKPSKAKRIIQRQYELLNSGNKNSWNGYQHQKDILQRCLKGGWIDNDLYAALLDIIVDQQRSLLPSNQRMKHNDSDISEGMAPQDDVASHDLVKKSNGQYEYRGFIIQYDPPGVPTRAFDWQWYHPDYDGAPDSNDARAGHAASLENAKQYIDELLDDW